MIERRSFLFSCFGLGAMALLLSSNSYARGINLRGLGKGIRHGESAGSEADVLSRDELINCFEKKHRLDNINDSLEEKEKIIEAELREIDKEKEEIERARIRVDSYSQNSVDNFNSLVDQHSRRIDYYNNHSLKEYNEIAIRSKSLQNEYNFYCGGKTYYIEDYEAVKRELKNSQ